MVERDSIGRRKTKHGTPYQFFLDSIKKDTEDCILWRYALCDEGYGKLIIQGKKKRVHRLALEHTLGKSDLDALHSCRNKNCFNPKHLRYGTAKENIDDARKDGTLAVGSKVGCSKLKEEQIPAIIKDERSLRAIAKDYGVDHKTIFRVKSGRGWAHAR